MANNKDPLTQLSR